MPCDIMMHLAATELNWSLEVYFGDKEYFGGQRFWPAESWGDPRTYNWLLTYNTAANRCSAHEAHYHHRGCFSGYSVSGRLSLGPLSHTGPRHLWHRDDDNALPKIGRAHG